MCGRRLRRFCLFLSILCCLSPAFSWAEDLPAEAMTDEAILSELMENWKLQSGVHSQLRLSLTDLNVTLQNLESQAGTLDESLRQLEGEQQSAQRSLSLLETRLSEQETKVRSAQSSLRSTQSSLDGLESSLQSYSAAMEKEVSSLKRQNTLWMILTLVSASIAVTALLIN